MYLDYVQLYHCVTLQALFAIIIAAILIYLLHFYSLVFFAYPKGPVPLPLIGNILSFRNYKHNWNYEIMKLHNKYGPIFTIWFGKDPFVFICDVELAKEVFNKIEFSGRPSSDWGNVFNNKNHRDIALSDYGPTWACLRNVMQSTIKNYARTDNFANLVSNTIIDNIDKIKKMENNIPVPFSPQPYVFNICSTIIASSLFSFEFNSEEKSFNDFKYYTIDWVSDMGNKLFVWNFVPIMRLFMKDPLDRFRNSYRNIFELAKSIYDKHLITYDKNMKGDFCDILLNAKFKALDDEKDCAKYLLDENLIASLMDCCFGGVETTYSTFQWLLLFIAYYPEYQQRLRNEIQSVLSHRKPTLKDKEKLHFVMAFISETLRFRNPTPLGVFHKAVTDSKIGIHRILKGTKVVLHQFTILMDNKQWSNPEQFIPERFLDENEKYLSVKPTAYIPFSIGRRMCPGEQLAYAHLFLSLVILLQQTSDFNIVLQSPLDVLEPDNINLAKMHPKMFKILLKSKIYL